MLEINPRRLHCNGHTPEICTDGSVRFVKYDRVEEPDELLTMRKGYSWQSTSYTLSVNLPPVRTVDFVLTVSHVSVNAWRVTYSSHATTEVCSMRTLGEVNEYLSAHLV